MINAAIAGVTGYAGIELLKLISNHPQTQLLMATSNTYAGKALTEVFPSMRDFDKLICEEFNFDRLPENLDIMFLALPHKVSMQYAPKLLERGIKVIDLSADFRFSDPVAYEAVYQPHSAKELLKKSVYGLCEIYRDKIASSSLIGNPGCYPTSILLPLIPLLKDKLIEPEGIIADSKSGVSGAGRGISLSSHFCEVNESFTPYKVCAHRHTPEINEILSLQSGLNISLTFVPHLLPLTRGMLSTIYVMARGRGKLDKLGKLDITEQTIRDTYEKWYGKEPFIRITKKGLFPAVSHVKGTNCCDIGIHFSQESGRIILVSAIDNLIKGAAGQAVQNMNIMFGLDEDMGLNFVQTPF